MFTARLILRCPGYYVTVYLSLHYLWRYLWQCAVNFRSSSQTKQTNEWEWMALVFLELIRTVHFHSTLYHFTSSSPISYHMYRQTNIHTHIDKIEWYAARPGMVTDCTEYVPSCHGWNFYAMSWCDALDIKVCVFLLSPGPFIVWTRIHSFHIYCRIKSDLQNVEMIHSIRIISHNCITFSILPHSWHKTISKSLFRTETFRKLETYYLYLF